MLGKEACPSLTKIHTFREETNDLGGTCKICSLIHFKSSTANVLDTPCIHCSTVDHTDALQRRMKDILLISFCKVVWQKQQPGHLLTIRSSSQIYGFLAKTCIFYSPLHVSLSTASRFWARGTDMMWENIFKKGACLLFLSVLLSWAAMMGGAGGCSTSDEDTEA